MSRADKLYNDYNNANSYLEKIGKPEHHFNPTTYGRVTGCLVKTEICWQASSGSKNYWQESEFDLYLAKVVKENFQTLAVQALDLMKTAAENALLEEENELLERLKKIKAIKESS